MKPTYLLLLIASALLNLATAANEADGQLRRPRRDVLEVLTSPTCVPCRLFWYHYETDSGFRRWLDQRFDVRKRNAGRNDIAPQFRPIHNGGCDCEPILGYQGKSWLADQLEPRTKTQTEPRPSKLDYRSRPTAESEYGATPSTQMSQPRSAAPLPTPASPVVTSPVAPVSSPRYLTPAESQKTENGENWLCLPIPKPRDGKDGKDGRDGEDGKDGRDAVQIPMEFHLTLPDGSEMSDLSRGDDALRLAPGEAGYSFDVNLKSEFTGGVISGDGSERRSLLGRARDAIKGGAGVVAQGAGFAGAAAAGAADGTLAESAFEWVAPALGGAVAGAIPFGGVVWWLAERRIKKRLAASKRRKQRDAQLIAAAKGGAAPAAGFHG